jgi:hypothetical protein
MNEEIPTSAIIDNVKDIEYTSSGTKNAPWNTVLNAYAGELYGGAIHAGTRVANGLPFTS